MTAAHADNLTHQVVRASAGAGKTYQLTTRYLRLLGRGESAQHILATTFTRKAAGEVLARVLGRLAGACADAGEREQLAEALGETSLSQADCTRMLRSLTDGLNRLSVGTIDGFFNRAARAFSFELGLPADPRLVDEGSPLARQLRTDAIHAVLGEHASGADGMATLIEMLRRLHHDTAQRSVTDAIDGIVSQLDETYRAYSDRSLWDAIPDAGLLSAELLQIAIDDLEAMRDQIPLTQAGKPDKRYTTQFEKLLASARQEHWDGVLGNGLVKKIISEELVYYDTPIDADWQRAIKPLLMHAKAVRLKALSDQTLATHDLLAVFHDQYKAMRQAQRLLLFSDLTHVLADGLPGMGEAGVDELCYRLDTRVTHLLLDEFQDTSLRQWQVLESFAQQVVATGDGSRSLYCVGDTKQAIYGWRGGCAELFSEVEALPGVERQTLSTSWRSSQVVLDTVNRVFCDLSTNAALKTCDKAAADWEAQFTMHAAQFPELPGHTVLHSTMPANGAAQGDDEDDETAPPDAHAHYVAGYIQRLTQRMPGRSVGVLMRARAKARTLMHALRALGVNAAEEGGNPIDNVPAVSAVLSAVQLADHPGDSVCRFHVVNSPLAEVVGLSGVSEPADVEAAARRIRRSLMDHGYAAVFAGWTRALAPSCDDKSLRRLVQLIELAEQFDEHDAGLRPSFFVEAARAAKVQDAQPASVRVMTIHASKGLEFDTVVLPDLDAGLSRPDSKALVVLDRDSPVAPVRGIYRRVDKDVARLLPELEHAHEQHAYEQRTEDLCLLYVAMTRARQGLHMLVRPLTQTKSGKPGTSGLTSLSYAAILRQALCENPGQDEGFGGDELLFESGEPGWAGEGAASSGAAAEPTTEQAQPLKIDLRGKGPAHGRAWRRTSPSQMHKGGDVSAADLLRLSDPGGRDYGTLMHSLFEQVGFLDEGIPSDEQLLAAAGPAGAGSIDPAPLVEVLKRALAVPAVQELLSRDGADTLWRERSFVAHLDESLLTGVFDRVHLWHEDGTPTRGLIIDFKTDRVDDAGVDEVAAGYAGQLGLYRKALSQITGLGTSAIRTVLCFVGDGRVVEVG